MKEIEKIFKENPGSFQLNFLAIEKEKKRKDEYIISSFYNTTQYFTNPFYKIIRPFLYEYSPMGI